MSTGQLDDATIESIVAGDQVDARLDHIVAFARQARSLGDGPPPPPSPALEALLAGPPPPPSPALEALLAGRSRHRGCRGGRGRRVRARGRRRR
jgi:hypothetical protein